MRVLVFGGHGWIGKKVVEELQLQEKGVHIIYYKGHVNSYSDIPKIVDILRKNSIDRVVDCCGKTYGPGMNNIDYLKGKLQENMTNNFLSHFCIMSASIQVQVHCTILGTGCIYDNKYSYNRDKETHWMNIADRANFGDLEFLESDDPNYFGSDYSIVKGSLDQVIRANVQDSHILHVRIRMPIDNCCNPRNLITKLSGYQYVTDIPNSMSVLPDLIPKMVTMLRHGTRGVFNLVNPGSISHQEIMELYKQIVDPSHEVRVFSNEEQQKILLEGRSNNILSTTKLCEELSTRNSRVFDDSGRPNTKISAPLPIRDAVIACLKQYKLHVFNPSVILVTGSNGFLASHLVRFLFDKYPGAKILALDKHAQNIQEGRRDRIIEIHLDLTDEVGMKKLFETWKIDSIFHLGAETSVCKSYTNSINFTKSNVLGTHILLECCRNANPKITRFIQMSTDEVLGQSGSDMKTETSLTNPSNMYSASKLGAEAFCQSYIQSFSLPITIVRCNNIYGPGQYNEKLVSRFMCRILRGLPLQIHGNGGALRSFIYVSDVVEALMCIFTYGCLGEIYNIASEDEFSVAEVTQKLLALQSESPLSVIEYVPDRPFQDVRYLISANKLKALGWRQTIRFKEGLDRTWSWYKENYMKFPADA